MGRVYLTYFDQTPDTQFYLCRACQVHIALPQEFVDIFIFLIHAPPKDMSSHAVVDLRKKALALPGNRYNELAGGVFRNVANVHTLSPEQNRRVGDRILSDVYCNSCGNLLGVKFIEVASDDEAVTAGYFLLRREKLKKWNGQEIVD